MFDIRSSLLKRPFVYSKYPVEETEEMKSRDQTKTQCKQGAQVDNKAYFPSAILRDIKQM